MSFELTCPRSDLTSVTATGPCALPDGGTSWAFGDSSGCTEQFIDVPSPTRTGVCHFVLTFATGYTFAKDVAFSQASGGCPGCPGYIGANVLLVNVPNPPDTCLASDAGDGG
jgi:hypothetical protein